ncbi:MAG: DUF2231 domain-containing protein [Brevundimonas sp.]|jgi:uncharacterized membrane protein
MTDQTIQPRVAIAGLSLRALLMPFPIACFSGALLTDITYAQTAVIQWANFSAWLLAVGMLTGGIAFLFGLIDLFFGDWRRRSELVWARVGVVVVLLAVALVNNFVHARDGWTSVVPTGLTLSVVTVLLMMVSGVLGELNARRAGGVA